MRVGRGRGPSREDWLDRLGLADLAAPTPGDLSGGQAQRVALARALAGDPALLLLDEPLSALDARTRLDVQSELQRHLSGFAGPCLVVTHDPLEALVLADRLVVLEDGRIVQDGSPAQVARRPATEYVAKLVGLNLYTGTADGDEVAPRRRRDVRRARPRRSTAPSSSRCARPRSWSARTGRTSPAPATRGRPRSSA